MEGVMPLDRAMLLITILMFGVGLAGMIYGLRNIPREWRVLAVQQKRRVVLTLLVAVLYATAVLWIWAPLARGQEVQPVPASQDALVALERRVVDLEATCQRTANTFNPILHHGRTVEIWLSPPASDGTPPPALVLTRDALGRVQVFVDGSLHVQGPTILEDDLLGKGAFSFDERKSKVYFKQLTAPQP